MKIHFISIGGSVMHNMAIAMHLQGHEVSGSDDEIFEPAYGRLKSYGLLPVQHGWFPEKISSDIDMVILGMHARLDNPEMVMAMDLGLKIVSFPEFVYLNSLEKTRIVIAGSHGKTTITAMIMHVFRECGKNFDYLVGSSVNGFEHSFKISNTSDSIVIEGDEYLSSAINPEPKFLWYKPQIAVISGIAWDHANVFPTVEIYRLQFDKFIQSLNQDSILIYCAEDNELSQMVDKYTHIKKIPYRYPRYEMYNSAFYLYDSQSNKIALNINGSHNLMNIEAAKLVCLNSGISEEDFLHSIKEFHGAGKRLEKIAEKKHLIVFRDFAHAPSKVKATIEGVRNQFPEKKIFAFFELHTYSSLNADFMPQYANSMQMADEAFIFISEKAVAIKKQTMPENSFIKNSFNNQAISIIHTQEELLIHLNNIIPQQGVLLLMSSGNFDGLSNDTIASMVES